MYKITLNFDFTSPYSSGKNVSDYNTLVIRSEMTNNNLGYPINIVVKTSLNNSYSYDIMPTTVLGNYSMDISNIPLNDRTISSITFNLLTENNLFIDSIKATK